MKKYLLLSLIICFSILFADLRTYRQVTDISARQTGKVLSSRDKGNLFEFTYFVDLKNNTIKRVKVKRLDQSQPVEDDTLYKITGKKMMQTSKAGVGGEVLIAVDLKGNEIIQLGDDFAFTSRTSDFAQIISGVYKRIK